jgi:hypothetical protein
VAVWPPLCTNNTEVSAIANERIAFLCEIMGRAWQRRDRWQVKTVAQS